MGVGKLNRALPTVHSCFMPPRTIFMEGCLNEQYGGVHGVNKNFKKYQGHRILMVANGSAEATNDIHRYINNGYAFVTLTMIHKI